MSIDDPEITLDTTTPLNLQEAGINRFGAVDLLFNNIEKFLNVAGEKAKEGADFIRMNVPGVGNAVFTNTPEAAIAIFTNYTKTRPAKFAALVSQVFGGSGILTTTYRENRRSTPIAKVVGAESVKTEFSPNRMNSVEEFQETLNQRASRLVSQLADPNNKETMDSILQKSRIDYLASLYLSFNSDEEISGFNKVWKYTAQVFGDLFKLTILNELPGVNEQNLLHIPVLTSYLGRMKEESDAVVLNEIDKRIDSRHGELPYDLLSQMVLTNMSELKARGTDYDLLDEEAKSKVKSELASNFYQIFFASLETSKAGILSTHMELANHDKFLELQSVVDNFVNSKNGVCNVAYQDLTGDSPMLGPIIDYAMRVVVDKIITPVTNREISETFYFQDKNGNIQSLQEGDLAFIDIGHISRLQLQEIIASGESIDNIKSAVSLLIFGEGFSKCKGAHWAVYEIVTQLVHTLHKSKSFNVNSSKYRKSATNTYYDVDARIEQRAA